MKQSELTVTVLSTKDKPDVSEIILASFAAFLKKEIHILAASRCFVV